jgi:S1-C subfamily serine protease
MEVEMNKPSLARVVLIALFAGTLILLTSCQFLGINQAGSAPTEVVAQTQNATATPPSADLAIGLAEAVRNVTQQVKPAVVQVTNEVVVDQLNSSDVVPAGVGSGVIYDAEGHILTNNHVVAGAEQLLVSLPDGRSFPAELVGRDPQTDVAVIQIKGDNLPVAQLGDSGQLQVGDWVIAIGNALALPGGPTVTVGVVSALGRAISEPSSSGGGGGPFLFDLIQTDAAINPGNSGGPLVDLQGRVVGLNTLGGGQTGSGIQTQGIGFAVSIATAKEIAAQLIQAGKATHPYLGIGYVPLNPAIAAQLGIAQTQGIVIGQVVSESPADQAGLQFKDVITAVDGQELVGESDFAQIVSRHEPGDTITLAVLRDGQQLTLELTLGEAPSP